MRDCCGEKEHKKTKGKRTPNYFMIGLIVLLLVVSVVQMSQVIELRTYEVFSSLQTSPQQAASAMVGGC